GYPIAARSRADCGLRIADLDESFFLTPNHLPPPNQNPQSAIRNPQSRGPQSQTERTSLPSGRAGSGNHAQCLPPPYRSLQPLQSAPPGRSCPAATLAYSQSVVQS